MTYTYLYENGAPDHPVFVLLHGTGGDEHDLLPIAQFLDPSATIISIRGNVDENGMNRYFKRTREGVYDLSDLNRRGAELEDFIRQLLEKNHLLEEKVILIGFSNGANIAINMLLREDTLFRKAMLFAPMYPVDTSHQTHRLEHTSVYLSLGKHDPIVTLEQSKAVQKLFENRDALVTSYWVQSHEISPESLIQSQKWLRDQNI